MRLSYFLRRAVSIFPKKKAIIDGDWAFTYEEFGQRVNKLTYALKNELELKYGERVGIISPNRHEFLEACFGTIQAGNVLVPINIRLSAEEIVFMLNDVEAKVLFFDMSSYAVVKEAIPSLKFTTRFVVISDDQILPPCPEKEIEKWIAYNQLLQECVPTHLLEQKDYSNEEDTVEIFYTSGTTAKAKGVMLTQKNLSSNASNLMATLSLKEEDVGLHSIPLFHANNWGMPFALTAVGGTHIFLRSFEPENVYRLIERYKVTISCMVPTMVNMLLNYSEADNFNKASFSKLVVGGATSPEKMAREATETLGCTYIGSYGLTEASPVVTLSILKSELQNLSQQEKYNCQAKPGLPVIGVEIDIVDTEGNRLKHNGQEVGEVIVCGDTVMAGYWKNDQASKQVLKDGWLHTNDMGVIDEEGYLKIVDRKKDIIISGGENISSIELESVIYSHPAVLEVAVIGVPHEKWGEAAKAVIVLKEGYFTNEEDIMAHIAKKLARFKLPKSIDFVKELPKTGTGKIQKSILRNKVKS